ncbi:TM216 protein, partial [Polypterus senegalus]
MTKIGKVSLAKRKVGALQHQTLPLYLIVFSSDGSSKGNLTQRSLPLAVSLILTLPCAMMAVYYLLLQTYVLRVEVILNAILLVFCLFEIVLELATLAAFSSRDAQEDQRRACASSRPRGGVRPGYVGGLGYRAWKPSPVGTRGHRQAVPRCRNIPCGPRPMPRRTRGGLVPPPDREGAAPRCLRNPGAQHFRHTRKCWVEEDRRHPDGFRVHSRHFCHTGVCPRGSARKQLEPIRVPI